MSNERPTRAQIAAAQEINEAIERQVGGIETVSARLLASWARSLLLEDCTKNPHDLTKDIEHALSWCLQFDEKGNWIGSTANENGWTP